MNKKPIWLIGVGAAILFLIFFISRNNQPKTTLNNDQSTQFNRETQEKSINVAVIEPTEKTENLVPLPQETDIAHSFFNLIGEHKSSDAVMMMTPINTSDDSTKQAWAVQFNAFESMSVKSIEPSMQSDWTETAHTYKVILNVQMKPEAANAVPMPNYGWDNGENYRWVTLEKVNNRWMIGGIATGP